MKENNNLIQDKDVVKNILDRLNNNPDNIYLFDSTDNSYIAIDKFVIERIKVYYELLL